MPFPFATFEEGEQWISENWSDGGAGERATFELRLGEKAISYAEDQEALEDAVLVLCARTDKAIERLRQDRTAVGSAVRESLKEAAREVRTRLIHLRDSRRAN